MAENFKHQGNASFKGGKSRYKDAIHFYTQGITAKCEDNIMNSLLHSNRAAVNLELCNYRSCLYDCARAITLNPKNIKAYFRSVKALLALDRVDEGIDCAQKGLLVELDNQVLKDYLKKLQKRKLEIDELNRLRKIKEEKMQREAKELQDAIDLRQYRFMEQLNDDGEPIQKYQHPEGQVCKIELHPEGELSFPVVFLYPEFNQSDTISMFFENDSFYAHFQNMFSEACPWDKEHQYNPDNLDVYFETHPEKYSKENPSLVSVLKSVSASNAPSQSAAHRYVYTTLADVLKHESYRIVNGLVTFTILSRNSDFNLKYRKDFKALHQ